MSLTVIFFASMFYIVSKSFQQLNVVHKKYLWVIPTSLVLAHTESRIWIYVTENPGDVNVISTLIGLGAGIGCCIAMWLHKRYLK